MADPFLALSTAAPPVDPDPGFAATLRARVQRALSLPRGVAVSATTESATTESATTETTASRAARAAAGVTPYLAVAGAREALDWYAAVLGAQLVGEPIVMPDGRLGHAEFDVAGARLMISDEHPEIGVVAPQPGAGATVTLHLDVPDVDALVERAVGAGAALERPPADYPYGRLGVIRDPFGHRWMINTAPTAP